MKLSIWLIKSPIGRKPNHRATVEALGLRKINQVVEKESNPMILGMVNTISYLLEVQEIK